MMFFMYGMREEAQNKEKPFDIFIGITAKSEKEANSKLENLVREQSKNFTLYDIVG